MICPNRITPPLALFPLAGALPLQMAAIFTTVAEQAGKWHWKDLTTNTPVQWLSGSKKLCFPMAMAIPLDLEYTTRARARRTRKGKKWLFICGNKNDTTNKVRAEGWQKWRKKWRDKQPQLTNMRLYAISHNCGISWFLPIFTVVGGFEDRYLLSSGLSVSATSLITGLFQSLAKRALC